MISLTSAAQPAQDASKYSRARVASRQPGEEKAEVESSMVSTAPWKRRASSRYRVRADRAPRRTQLDRRSEVAERESPGRAMLTPGDTVQADSLERGWYRRVALEGEVLGYAHHSTLAALR